MRLRTRRQSRRRRHEGAAPDPLTVARARRQVRTALGGKLQPALKVGAPNDAFEQEADRIADAVTGRPVNGMLQRQASGETTDEKPEALTAEANVQKPDGATEQEAEEQKNAQPGPAAEAEKQPEETVQAKDARGNTVAPAAITQVIRNHRGRGEPLPGPTRRFFESRLGTSFRRVRVHADATAARLNDALGARAFTVGHDVFFARGAYAPDSPSGRHLLAHELTHVLQQRRGLNRIQRRVIPERVNCFNNPGWTFFPQMGVSGGVAAINVIQAAVNRAVALLDDAIAELEYTRSRIQAGEPAAWPVISDTVARALRRRLRLNPKRRRTWTGSGPGTVEMAIRRFRNIRWILADNRMRYNCWEPGCPAGVFARTNRGQYQIRLCRQFWERTLDARAITLIHEGSHIFEGTKDSGHGIDSAYCLEQFICDLNTLNVCMDCG